MLEDDLLTIERLRDYFSTKEDKTDKEHGCLLLKTGQIIPFENDSKNPLYEITLTDDFMGEYIKLLAKGEIYAWVHSHPRWKATPSYTDICNHPAGLVMGIYSVPEDNFRFYTAAQLRAKRSKLVKK